jgi:glycosyltransferase involved in cell wall biosynthesis
MRILHLVHQYLPDYIGGVELYTQTLAKHQVKQGHAVAVFSPSSTAVASTEDGVQVYRTPLGPRDSQAIFFSTFRHAVLSRAWREALSDFRPDLVHVQHLMGVPVDVVAWLLKMKCPYAVTLHDYFYFCANALLLTNYDQALCGGPRWWINCGHCAIARAGHERLAWLSPAVAPLMAYRQYALRRVLTRADRLIAPTQFVHDQYCRQLGLLPDRVRVIVPGLDVPTEVEVNKRQRSAHDPLRVVFVGGITYQKGVHVLIDAVNQLTDDHVQVSIYGDLTAFPDYAAKLQRRARSAHITFHGRIPHDQVWRVLSESDVLVVPSLSYESSSLIIQEAFAMRTPVIASDLGALRETALNGGGLVLPPGDTSALRDVLLHFINSPTELESLRGRIQPRHSIEAHIAAVEAVYHEAVKA